MRTLSSRIAFGIALFFVLTLGFAFHAQSEWLMTSGIETLVIIDDELTRVDSSPVAPYHEINQGRYGYYVEGGFVPVLDFSYSNPIIAPFTWDDVKWVPGSMDADSLQQ